MYILSISYHLPTDKSFNFIEKYITQILPNFIYDIFLEVIKRILQVYWLNTCHFPCLAALMLGILPGYSAWIVTAARMDQYYDSPFHNSLPTKLNNVKVLWNGLFGIPCRHNWITLNNYETGCIYKFWTSGRFESFQFRYIFWNIGAGNVEIRLFLFLNSLDYWNLI